MARIKTVQQVKASESVVVRLLAKALHLRLSEDEGVDVQDVCSAYGEIGRNEPLIGILNDVRGLYPWVVGNVASDIMSGPTTPLTEQLLCFAGSSFIVKDDHYHGADSLWVAIGDPQGFVLDALARFENRGLIRTRRLPDGSMARILAFQLSSCTP